MTLTLELTPAEVRRVEQAKRQGYDVEAMLRGVIAGLPDSGEDRTEELFAQWEQEDKARLATMTPEEIAAEDAQWDEIMCNIRQNRVDFPIPDLSDHD